MGAFWHRQEPPPEDEKSKDVDISEPEYVEEYIGRIQYKAQLYPEPESTATMKQHVSEVVFTISFPYFSPS